MFKQRLLTALVMVPLVLLAIYYGNNWLLGAIILLFLILSGWEWLQLIPITKLINQFIFIVVLITAVWLSNYWLDYWLIVGLVLWLLIFIAVITYPASQKIWGSPIVVGTTCLILLPLFVSTLVAIYQYLPGKDLIVYLFCLVWAADIGAYIAGKGFGQHKLIPRVSPGKTIEGALGGFILSMIVASMGYYYFSPSNLGVWFLVAALTTLISMLGDLFISMLKRRRNLKDTGQIFPGHGGVLDRLDSMIAALPLFYFGLHFTSLGL